MSDSRPSRPRRSSLLLIGAGIGVLLASAGALALVSGLAIADQPGQAVDVPALVVEVDPAPGPTSPASPSTPAPVSPTSEPGSPALVPAPAPLVVDDDGDDDAIDGGDDNGGDRPDD
ncbi:hypothetical protein [Cryobacterium cryoconiti]|uniref:Small secreted hydrophilic protein n=1 Tax=Cryobacterium cryoconiti TaxID=1259239 RepID=A0A4Y8K391_9MICO|nr:hypothetical protein [Cryobacterium cryoconiti]TFD33018.1 hypothetical protein E3T49_01575 [Cryobacterium cryoconiti]